MQWRNYLEGKNPVEHTIVGTLLIAEGVNSPQLNNQRDVLVYLPPSYHDSGERRYPVLYFHDGQNVFDDATSFVGEWHADETLELLAGEGLEAIAVGIPNISTRRVHELSPFASAGLTEGLGGAYLAFIVETVKPLIDAEYRTAQDRTLTGILGSSLGGLISLYGYYKYPQVFGFAGIFSPAHLRYGMLRTVETTSLAAGKLYVDVGTDEMGNIITDDPIRAAKESKMYLEEVWLLRKELNKQGFSEGSTLMYVEDEGAVHNEGAWSRRLPDALRFLLNHTRPY